MSHRLLIVDDHPIVRRGLREMAENDPDLEVCGEAADLDEALRLVDDFHPDVAVIDLTLKNCHGLDLIEQIRERNKQVKMLVSSMHDESLYAERALRCGASGYINKQEPPEKILRAIHDILRGEICVSAKIADRLLRRLQTGQNLEEDPIQRLTNRELEVFELIGQGLSTKQIAQRLELSPKTIEAHRDGIRGKLQLTNSLEVSHRAMLWVAEGR